MLGLAATYADIWNLTEYVARPEEFTPKGVEFEAARVESGSRHVDSSVMLKVGWRDLGDVPGFFGQDWVTGTPEHLAATFNSWSEAGVAHVMCQYHPNKTETLQRLIEGLYAYRGQGSP